MAAHIDYFKHEDAYVFVSTLRNLKVDAPDGIYSLMPGIDLIVGKELKGKYLTPELRDISGRIEFEHLLGACHLIVGDVPGSFFDILPLTGVITMWLGWVDWLMQDSWLVKDNSIICEIAYCKITKDGGVQWANNGLYSKMFTARGLGDIEVVFNAEEIQQWNTICDNNRSLIFSNKSVMTGRVSDKSYSRYARFYHFLDTSRRTPYEAIKIAHCCSALESLFSTDTVELSHRLSERVAFLFAKNGYDAETVYQFIKDCYAVRSSVTHGSPVPSKFSKGLETQSEKLQEHMRALVFMINKDKNLLDVLNGSNEGIELYFRKLIFPPVKAV
ncbi:HEPN domain-containing protein [Pseudomonas sp. K5002]|uniref:HEPN domain-containing protein n=1 Tax=Pseudomonas sp. K5002 TaxID=2738828 RepID=UPI0015BF3BB3|nr:HEPN domain-containing protein [Pseudomonas sp. K5002]NWD89254.1 hypothetical protein [Pseudomonas sp. K5002]